MRDYRHAVGYDAGDVINELISDAELATLLRAPLRRAN